MYDLRALFALGGRVERAVVLFRRGGPGLRPPEGSASSWRKARCGPQAG